MQLAGGTRHDDIQVPACDEPKLKKDERLALYAEHRARSAAKIAAHTQSQTLVATPDVNVARGSPTSFNDQGGFGLVMSGSAAPTVPVGPQWEDIEIKAISDLAETLTDNLDRQHADAEAQRSVAPVVNRDAFENGRWAFRQANGRWPNAEEEADILVQIQQRAVSELQIEDKLEELRREWRVQNGAWPNESETETLRELARSLVDSSGARPR